MAGGATVNVIVMFGGGRREEQEQISPIFSLLGHRYCWFRGWSRWEGDRRGTENKVDIQNEEMEHQCIHEFIENLREASA